MLTHLVFPLSLPFLAHRYCLADDRLEEAVKFLDLGDRAGWQLLQVESEFKINYFSRLWLIMIFFFYMYKRYNLRWFFK